MGRFLAQGAVWDQVSVTVSNVSTGRSAVAARMDADMESGGRGENGDHVWLLEEVLGVDRTGYC